MNEQQSRVLIVDDERISLKAISACLEDDYQIMAATSCAQAMKAVESKVPPDLILLDVMMPDIDGFETCKRLKAHPIGADIPVIFLTAKDHDRDEARGLELGAVDYIGKPVVPAIVRARVKAQIDLQRYLRELKQAYTTIEIQRDRMEEELQVAQQLQQSLLPKFQGRDESVSVHASMRSAREVSGDFYDVFYIGPEHLCVCIGDVAGKGVPAALFMGITKALVRAKAGFNMSTASIVTHVNSEVLKNNDACMFVTLFVAILEIKTGRLLYTNAGHNPPLLTDANKDTVPVDTLHGPPVGASPHEYSEDVIWMSKEGTLFLYTDGITEARNKRGQLYGESRLFELLETMDTTDPHTIVDSIASSVEQFAGEAPRTDDLTMVCLRLNIDAHPKNYGRHTVLLGEREIASRTATNCVRQFLDNIPLDREIRNVLNIAIDEVITNIVTHGLMSRARPYIFITLEQDKKQVTLRFTDNGIEFNPLDAPTPDISLPLNSREPGGLGIHLCKTLMDGMRYKRRNLRNHLTMFKSLESGDVGSARTPGSGARGIAG